MTVLSPASKQVLPAKDVLKLYAKHLESESWCIDSSGTTVMALHASSGYPANLDHFKNIFPAWSRQTGIRVQQDQYEGFLTSLRFKLPTHLHSILGSTMRPVAKPFIPVNGAMFSNTYVPFNPPRPDDCSAPLAEELLERLFPDESERTWCKQFIAHAIQKPLERPQHGLLITGEGATCKSSLMRLVRSALGGRHWYSKNDYTQAMQKFSEVLPDNLIVVFDDAPADKGTVYENLKDAVTRDTQTVELKNGQKLVTREVYSRIVVISNLKRPLRLVDDRRFFAPAYCVHQKDKADSEAFGKRLDTWIKEPGTGAILYHWLMDVDLEGFTVSGCPRTETLIQMEGASTPALERHVCTFIEDRSDGYKKPIFHEREIAAYLFNVGLSKIHPDETAHKLIAQGYEISKRRNPFDDKKFVHLWQPAGQKRARDLTESEKDGLKMWLVF